MKNLNEMYSVHHFKSKLIQGIGSLNVLTKDCIGAMIESIISFSSRHLAIIIFELLSYLLDDF